MIYFFFFHYFFLLISCTRGILGSLQTSNAGTTSLSTESVNGIQLEVSRARVLYDTKEYSDERNRTYSGDEGDKSDYLMKDDSLYNSKSSCHSYCSGSRIVGNENGMNVDIVKNNLTNRCNECDNYNVNNDHDKINTDNNGKNKNNDDDKTNSDNNGKNKYNDYDDNNLKIASAIDGIRENQKITKNRKILSIASTLWGFGFIVE